MVALKRVFPLCLPQCTTTKQERRGGIETDAFNEDVAKRYGEAGTPWWH